LRDSLIFVLADKGANYGNFQERRAFDDLLEVGNDRFAVIRFRVEGLG